MPFIDLKKVNEVLINFNSLNDSEKKEFLELLEIRKKKRESEPLVRLNIKKRKTI